MKNKFFKKKYLFILVLIVAPILVELAISNFNVNFQYKEDAGIKEISLNEMDRSEIVEDNKKMVSYKFDNIDRYIEKLEIHLLNDKNNEFEIQLNMLNEFDVSANKKMNILLIDGSNLTTQYIGGKVESMVIKSANLDFAISGITIKNIASFNMIRFSCFAFFSLFIGVVCYFRNSNKFQLEKVFVLLAVLVGVLFIVAYPNVSHWAPDSQIHFERMYRHSFTKTNVEMTTSSIEARKLPEITMPNTVEDNQIINTILNDKKNNEVIGMEQKKMIAPYNEWGYFPSSFGFKVARLVNLPFTFQFMVGKLMNLFFFILLGYGAIKYASKGKRLFFVLATLPVPIFFATQYSLDGIIYSSILFGISLFIGQYLDEKRKVSFMWTLGFILSISFASFCKAVYAPFILLPLLFKKEKFNSTKQKNLFKVGLCLIFMLLIVSMILPIISNSGAPGDTRGGITSASGQIMSLITHPLAFIDMFSNILIDSIPMDLMSYQSTSFFYYLGELRQVYSFVILALLLFLSFTDWNLEKRINVSHKMFFVIILVSIVGMIYGALYISFTPVGMTSVNGIQPRYFTPLLPLLLFLPATNGIKNQFSSYKITLIIEIIMSIILFVSIYSVIIVRFCN